MVNHMANMELTMKTKELIRQLELGKLEWDKSISDEVSDEIIQKLRMLEDMKAMIGDILNAMDTIDELFIFNFFGEEE